MDAPHQRVLVSAPALDRDTGYWLGALEESRARTKQTLASVDPAMVDRLPPTMPNAIGTLLYHIALIEADYLCVDVMGLDDTFLPELLPLFPFPDRDETRHLFVVRDLPLADHLDRLDRVRAALLDHFATMSRDTFERSRVLEASNYEISPLFTLHHLMQHEAEHRGEINALITWMVASPE